MGAFYFTIHWNIRLVILMLYNKHCLCHACIMKQHKDTCYLEGGGWGSIAEGELVMSRSNVETICVIFTNIHKNKKKKLLTLHLLKMCCAEDAKQLKSTRGLYCFLQQRQWRITNEILCPTFHPSLSSAGLLPFVHPAWRLLGGNINSRENIIKHFSH